MGLAFTSSFSFHALVVVSELLLTSRVEFLKFHFFSLSLGSRVEFRLFLGLLECFLRSDLVESSLTILSPLLEFTETLNLTLFLLLDTNGFANSFFFALDHCSLVCCDLRV